MSKKIKLKDGVYAIVDESDYEELSKHKWTLKGDGYAHRGTPRPERKWILMHRQIMQPLTSMQVDHINGNRLDNRKENLMIVNYSQSQINRKIGTNNKSGYKGVHKNNKSNKWFANIRIDGKIKYLGGFGDIKEAVRVRDNAVKKYYGDFMRK